MVLEAAAGSDLHAERKQDRVLEAVKNNLNFEQQRTMKLEAANCYCY